MTDYKEYIYAVYQEKSFSKAARQLHVSQPWLSAAVKKVEQELGLPLFDRSTNPISLTEAGRYYIARTEEIMAIQEEMAEHFSRLRDAGQTELRIGSSMFFCTYNLPFILKDFQRLYPQAVLTFTEGENQTLVERLLAGQLDLLLEAERLTDKRIHTIPWTTEEIILAVPAQNPVNRTLTDYCYSFGEFLSRSKPGGRRSPVPLEAFRQEPFILLKEGNDIHQRSLQLCRNAGFIPNVSLYLTQMMTAYYLVCEGQGITFLHAAIPDHVDPTDKVVFYQMDDPLAVRSLYLSYLNRGGTPLRQCLIDFMKGTMLQ